MKKIHRHRIVAVLLCMFTCALFSGCQKSTPTKNSNVNSSQGSNKETVVEKVTVTYDDDNGETNKVSVNFLDNTKTTILFQEEAKETTEEFDVDDSFSEFIKENILTDSTADAGDSAEEADDQKVLWRIEVRTNDDNYHFNGFDEYPSYWEELLQYMGL